MSQLKARPAVHPFHAQSADEDARSVLDQGPVARPSIQEQPQKHAFPHAPAPEWPRVHELAMRQLDRFVSLEPKVLRGDDVEAVHDLRVASRRLQQLLKLLYPAPAPREIRRLNRKLRRARCALSDLRNCDVQIAHVNRLLRRKHRSRRATWEAIRAYLAQRREATLHKSLHKLTKNNIPTVYVRLKHHLDGDDRASQNGGAQGLHDDSAGREEFLTRISQMLAGLWQTYEARIAESHQNPAQSTVHAARIAAKRLRYLVEVMREFGLPGSIEALAWLRKVQQHLGDWHDAEVLEQFLIEMVARPEFLKEQLDLAMAVEKIIVTGRANKARCLEKFFRVTSSSAANERLQEWANSFVHA